MADGKAWVGGQESLLRDRTGSGIFLPWGRDHPYALALAAAATALRWLEYRYLARTISPEFYILLLEIGFIGLGAWAGHRLTA